MVYVRDFYQIVLYLSMKIRRIAFLMCNIIIPKKAHHQHYDKLLEKMAAVGL